MQLQNNEPQRTLSNKGFSKILISFDRNAESVKLLATDFNSLQILQVIV
jgi:hypothetical protein